MNGAVEYEVPRGSADIYEYIVPEASPEPPEIDTIPTGHSIDSDSYFLGQSQWMRDVDDKLNKQTLLAALTASHVTKRPSRCRSIVSFVVILILVIIASAVVAGVVVGRKSDHNYYITFLIRFVDTSRIHLNTPQIFYESLFGQTSEIFEKVNSTATFSVQNITPADTGNYVYLQVTIRQFGETPVSAELLERAINQSVHDASVKGNRTFEVKSITNENKESLTTPAVNFLTEQKTKEEETSTWLIINTTEPTTEKMQTQSNVHKELQDKESLTIPAVDFLTKQKTKEEVASTWLVINTTEPTTEKMQTQNNVHNDSVVMLHVTPLSVGLKNCRSEIITFIERNTIVPATASQIWWKFENEKINFAIYAWDGSVAREQHVIGTLTVAGHAYQHSRSLLNITFQIFRDGTLFVNAKETKRNNENSLTITNYHRRLSPKDL